MCTKIDIKKLNNIPIFVTLLYIETTVNMIIVHNLFTSVIDLIESDKIFLKGNLSIAS